MKECKEAKKRIQEINRKLCNSRTSGFSRNVLTEEKIELKKLVEDYEWGETQLNNWTTNTEPFEPICSKYGINVFRPAEHK